MHTFLFSPHDNHIENQIRFPRALFIDKKNSFLFLQKEKETESRKFGDSFQAVSFLSPRINDGK